MDNAKEPICIRVLHELQDVFTRRFRLSDGRLRSYAVWVERGSGFRICADERVVARVAPAPSASRLGGDGPGRLEVFLGDEHRGHIRRADATSFRRDVLILDGRAYDLPRWMERDVPGLGMEMYWGTFGSRPSICVHREGDLPVALVVLSYVYVRRTASWE